MSSMKSECRKFSPNVFNKSKCQNCFQTKDAHSAQALESNRASRNVSKCGYLFVAPDWDFNVSVNRTKRWQRRWFVLYDDGELTYSLDEFPDTLPQCTIDVNTAAEVCDAEAATGNEFALGIHAADRTHFVKGTSREESKWWLDALLRVLPRHQSRAKHKRNATFPCANATIPAVIAQDFCSEDDIRLGMRPKFLSSSEVSSHVDDADWANGLDDEDVFDSVDEAEIIIQRALQQLMSGETPNGDQVNNCSEQDTKDPLSQLQELESRRRSRRYLKREVRAARSQRSRVEGVSKMLPPARRPDPHPGMEYLDAIHTRQEGPLADTAISPSPPTPLSSSTPKIALRKSESLRSIPSESRDQSGGLRRYHSFKCTTGVPSAHRLLRSGTRNQYSSLPRSGRHSSDTMLTSNPLKRSESTNISGEHTSDGEGRSFVRTGWLLRQTLSKDWSRHWFVLRDSSFAYFRDPSAQHSGIMDGILDLNQASDIREHHSDRFAAFSLAMWDGKKHVLAAETEDSRRMWLLALQHASNLWSSVSKGDFTCTEIVLPSHSFHQSERTSERVASPSSLCSMSMGNLDKETSSSDDQSEYFSIVDEDEVSDLSSSPRTLPPSPPINRNVMSLVKEKSKTRSAPKNVAGDACDANDANLPESEIHSNLQMKSCLSERKRKDISEKYDGEQTSHVEISPKANGKELGASAHLLKLTSDFDASDSDNSKRAEASNSEITKDKECSTCLQTKYKLVAAKEEIRKLKLELKEAHESFDNLEMFSYKLTQDMKLKEESYGSQIALMTAKIDDLTSKFSLAEKNYRQLKQKATKGEGKERRRSSLKNKEGLSLTKEYEVKLCELEIKIGSIESTLVRESLEGDESERSSSSQQSQNGTNTASSSGESSPGETKGMFSRLQTLSSRVKNVHDTLEQNGAFEPVVANPKILLQIRESDESPEDWHSLSLNGSLVDVNDAGRFPGDFKEFQKMCGEKICDVIEWIRLSLDYLCLSKGYSGSVKTVLCERLVDIVDSLYRHAKSGLNSESRNSCQILLVIVETLSFLKDMENVNDMKSLLLSNVAECAFGIILRVLCVSFADYENTNALKIVSLLSKIPHIYFFAPEIKKLLSECLPNENTSEILSSASERMSDLKREETTILDSLQKAKSLRFSSLWNTLADVPVQDDNGDQRSHMENSILRYITCIAEDIHQIAQLQITGRQVHGFLKPGQNEVEIWCFKTLAILKENQIEFMDELRELCPMVHESSVSLAELGDATRKEITDLVSELTFLSVSSAILKSLFTHSPSSEFEKEMALPEKFLKQLQESHPVFSCPQCNVLNDFLSNDTDWSSFAREFNARGRVRQRFDVFESNSKDVCNNVSCLQCDGWISKLCTTEKQHEMERQSLQMKHNDELQQLEECLIKSTEVHDQEMMEKENEMAEIRVKLQRLKLDYEQQIDTIKTVYEQRLSSEFENGEESSIRKIYKAEIEDLKTMFKKGLVAIENSHQQLATEMEHRHREEMELAEAEKERALQLEAEATITALEAIKRSHELQLQQETAMIKENLTNRHQNGESNHVFYSKYGNDLEKLKCEIVSITDLYSTKCLENATLEEKVNSLRQQLKDAHNELYDLLTKNEQMNIDLSNG